MRDSATAAFLENGSVVRLRIVPKDRQPETVLAFRLPVATGAVATIPVQEGGNILFKTEFTGLQTIGNPNGELTSETPRAHSNTARSLRTRLNGSLSINEGKLGGNLGEARLPGEIDELPSEGPARDKNPAAVVTLVKLDRRRVHGDGDDVIDVSRVGLRG